MRGINTGGFEMLVDGLFVMSQYFEVLSFPVTGLKTKNTILGHGWGGET